MAHIMKDRGMPFYPMSPEQLLPQRAANQILAVGSPELYGLVIILNLLGALTKKEGSIGMLLLCRAGYFKMKFL